VVCRRRREESELHRAGRSPEGQWYLGRGGGRGLWWCRDTPCVGSLSVSQVARAMRTTVTVGDLEELRQLAQRSKLVVVVEE